MRRLVLAGVALVVLSACGPSIPLQFSMRQKAVDIEGVPPLDVTVPAPDLPALPELPLPTIPTLPKVVPPEVKLCPEADDFAVPELEADANAINLPKPASYFFRTKGKLTTGGALPTTFDYPPFAQRQVVLGSREKGYDFAVAERVGALTRTIAYNLVTPTGPASLVKPTGAGTPAPAGLYLVAMQWDDPLTGKGTFRPAAAMQFFPLPAIPGERVAATGTDPMTGITVTWQGQIVNRERVDACGALIDAWRMTLSTITAGPQGEKNETATYWIATQYGGLSVADDVVFSSVQANPIAPTLDSELHSVISRVPEKVK